MFSPLEQSYVAPSVFVSYLCLGSYQRESTGSVRATL